MVSSTETVRSDVTDTIIVNEVPLPVLLLLLLAVGWGMVGWMLPTPRQLWQKWRKNAKETRVQVKEETNGQKVWQF